MIALNIFELLNEVKVSCDLLLPSVQASRNSSEVT